ncbi:MAG: 3-hydroxyacyl-CoA dehydrogenase NAD-binding domain-containing protein [Actinomycetes bacterium]
MTITPTDLPAAPDEVVTQAHVRIVTVAAGSIALITLDNGLDYNKPNTFGVGGLTALATALDTVDSLIERGAIVGVAITGKPFVFAVGADLTGVPRLASLEQAHALATFGHNVFRRLGELSVPSFAFINGAALGGGLEVALHCTYRSIASSAYPIALPEVSLGLVPGWGGAYLLPRLIGAPNALSIIVQNPLRQNRMISARAAAELGIADVRFDGGNFLVDSLRWASEVITGATTVTRRDIDVDGEWTAAISSARSQLDAVLHGAAPAAYRALELVDAARHRTRDEGFAAEDHELAALIMSEEFRAGMYSFDLVQRRAKRPFGAPDKSLARPITKIGIVGAGLMASQLALLFAQNTGVPIVLTDLDQERIDKGLGYVRNEIDTLLSKGKLNNDKANRLRALVSGSIDIADFADADVVIEAVFEELNVKKQVFAKVESVVSDTCLLLTNTSSLSVTDMAADLKHPGRVVGFHFFNPVALMPLVEIARAAHTDDASLATAFTLGKLLKKSCVLVNDRPGFVVNRLLTRFLGEVTAAFDEGTPFDVVEHALDPLGLPMPPFLLVQLVGPAIAFHTSQTLHDAFPDRFTVSENQRAIVDARISTLLDWDGPVSRLTNEVNSIVTVGTSPSTAEQVRQRALDAVAQEARLMLDEGVVAEPQDLDLCMLLGAGWPFHLGGITPYLDRTGTSERVTGQRFLPAGVASLGA